MSYNLESKVQKSLSNVEKKFIVDTNATIVCPWIIRNGATNLTETGRVNNEVDPANFGFFQKVFTGNECITATWENSTKLVKPTGVNAYDYQFQVGTYYSGAIVVGSGEYGTEIEPLESMEDFLSMKTQAQITVRFESWVPVNEDLFKLYTFPELYGKKWYYITNVRILNDLQFSAEDNTTSIPAVEVTFTSLIDKLQNTGKAVEQFVQYGAIGEPYAEPYVRKTEEEVTPDTGGYYIEPTKEVKYIVTPPRHSRYLQIELFGANTLTGLQIVGRKITQNEDETYRSQPWKFFLPVNFYNAQSNDINKTSLATKNFYYFPNETLVYRFSQALFTAIKNTNDALATNHNSGQFSMDVYSQWDNLATGLHKSNPLSSTDPIMHKDYNDLTWHPILTDYSLSANGCYYCADTINYTTSDTMLSILTKNGFVYSTQEVLPLGFYSSKPYKISNFPILGGIISKLGGDWTISARTKQRKPLSIGYFMDCDVAGMLANLFDHTQQAGQDSTIFAPTLALAGGEKAPKWLGTTACNTTLLMELTDKMLIDGAEVDTELFGQNKKPDLTWIDPTNHTTFLYSGQAPTYHLPTTEDKFWFVIDDIDVYAMHNGDIRASAYESVSVEPKPIFSTTVKSTANWTNSIRDWKTSIKTGCWSEQWCERTDDFTWPLNPSKPINPTIDTSYLFEDNSNSRLWNLYPEQNILPISSQTGFDNIKSYDDFVLVYRRNYNPKTYQVLYEDLGISGVTDKASFLNTVQSMKFNINYDIKIQNRTHTPRGPGKDYIYNDNSSYSITTDISNISQPINIAPIHLGNRGFLPTPYKKINTNDIAMYKDNYLTKIIGNVIIQGNLYITLNDTNISFEIEDYSMLGVDDGSLTSTSNVKYGYHIGYNKCAYSYKIDTTEFILK